MTVLLTDALAMSHDLSPNCRIEAANLLSCFDSEDVAIDRLRQMLNDDVVQVEVAAAEWLLKRCGDVGLGLVLDELIRRIDDPDTDYIRFMVLEVYATTRPSLLDEARAMAEQRGSETLTTVVNQLACEHEQMQSIPRHRIQGEYAGD